MSTSEAPGASKLEKIVGTVSTLAGLAPAILTFFGLYPVSIYQPAIYKGFEWFLLIPVGLGLLSLKAIMEWHWFVWVIGGLFLISACVVFYIYVSFGPSDPIHIKNWILSYCTLAFLFACGWRLILDWRGI